MKPDEGPPKDYPILPDLDPLDPPDPFDPTGYYDRKLKRAEEVLPYLAWAWVIFVVMVAATFIWNVVQAQEPVPFEEPCPGTTEPGGGPCVVYNQALVWIQTGDVRKLRWGQNQADLDTMVLEFEIEIFKFPPKPSQIPIVTGTTPEEITEFAWIPIRAGTYWARARSCNIEIPQDGAPIDGTQPEQRPDGSWILCSIWASSLDSTYTNPAVYPRGFMYHATLAPASGGGIE